MTIPTITTIIDPPLPTDAPAIFDQKAFAAWADLNTWADQANATATQINTDADRVNDPAVQAVASNLVSIVAVANNKTNIDRVSANQANINVVSANDANIKTVSGISSQVTTVAGMKTTVEAVNNNKTNIDNVAGNKANIDNVAGNKTNINTVAGNSANVTTVASNISSVNTTAGNMAAVIDAPIQATKAQTQATLADGYRQQAAASSTTATSAAVAASSSAGIAQTAAATAQAIVWQGTTGYPKIRPSLLLDFANSKTVDPRITFTRASTASYWDDKGILRQALAGQPRIDHDPATGECKGLLIEESRTNHVTGFTGNQYYINKHSTLSPNGTLDAFKLVENTQNGEHYIDVSNPGLVTGTTGKTYTFSVYAKAAEKVYLRIRTIQGFGDSSSIFDISNGSIPNDPIGGSTIELVGNGWYRISVKKTVIADNPQFRIQLYEGTGGANIIYAGDGVSGLHIYGMQVEEGSFPTSYIPTPATFTSRASVGTYFDSTGLLKTAAINEPRYDHGLVDGVWVPKGLLLEPQRTNLLTYSEQFDVGAFNKTHVSVEADVTTAPDGNTLADKLISSATLGGHYVYRSVPVTAGTTYTVSFFAKGAEYTKAGIRFFATNGAFANEECLCNLTTGVASNTGGTATSENLGNGWFRISLTATALATVTGNIGFFVVDSTISTQYTGDGTSGIYIWGAQLEEIPAGQSPKPSSYIKTEATAVTRSADVSTSSAVTRAADSAVMTGENFSSWYNQKEGTVFASYSRITDKGPGNLIPLNINDGSVNNIITITDGPNGSNDLVIISKNGVNQVNMGYVNYLANQQILRSLSFKKDDFVTVSNLTSTVSTDLSIDPPQVKQMAIGLAGYFSASRLNGHIAKLAYYPKRLPNNELQALTAE